MKILIRACASLTTVNAI